MGIHWLIQELNNHKGRLRMSGCRNCNPERMPNQTELEEIAGSMPPPILEAATEAKIKERLIACGHCEELREGVLCAQCGCFVRIRSRTEKAYCPHPLGNRWR